LASLLVEGTLDVLDFRPLAMTRHGSGRNGVYTQIRVRNGPRAGGQGGIFVRERKAAVRRELTTPKTRKNGATRQLSF
jgi:hypothetical protein